MDRISIIEQFHAEPVALVSMQYEDFSNTYGQAGENDKYENMEVRYLQMPWGQKAYLEYHHNVKMVELYVEPCEIHDVINYLQLQGDVYDEWIGYLRSDMPEYKINPYTMYEQDDNGNVKLLGQYESERVANYYQQQLQSQGHENAYWVMHEKQPEEQQI